MTPLHERYLETVRKTQWLAPDRLLGYQARLLEDIATHAYQAVPFYRERLRPLFQGATFDPRRWSEVTPLSRAEALAQGEVMRALSVPVAVARDTAGKTSGPTGPSLHFVMSELASIVSQCMSERMLEAHGVDGTAHLARIALEPPGAADYPDGSEDQGWNLSHAVSRRSRLNVHS